MITGSEHTLKKGVLLLAMLAPSYLLSVPGIRCYPASQQKPNTVSKAPEVPGEVARRVLPREPGRGPTSLNKSVAGSVRYAHFAEHGSLGASRVGNTRTLDEMGTVKSDFSSNT